MGKVGTDGRSKRNDRHNQRFRPVAHKCGIPSAGTVCMGYCQDTSVDASTIREPLLSAFVLLIKRMKMKMVTYILVGLLLLLAISQIWAQSQVSDIEMYPYNVLRIHENIEIREYEKANFIYATMDSDSYAQSSSKGFRTLAGYIFGGNERNQEIAMTSPVEMEMGNTVTMKFLVPAEYDIDEMPSPDNAEVKFMTEEKRIMAAISFGGFADDQKIMRYKELLFKKLADAGIEHTGQWSFMGYDPPYKLVDRRNEVLVELRSGS